MAGAQVAITATTFSRYYLSPHSTLPAKSHQLVEMDPSQQQPGANDDRDPNPFTSKNIFLGDAMMYNMKQLEMYNIVIYMAAGTLAGILGVTGKMGLLILITVAMISTLGLLIRMKFDVRKYTNFSVLSLFWSGMTSQALPFIFFWTFAYTMVHIY